MSFANLLKFSIQSFLMVFLASLFSCQSSELRELSYEEFMQRVNERTMPPIAEVMIRDEYGQEISPDSLAELARVRDIDQRVFVDQDGDVSEVHVIPRRALKQISVDCDNIVGGLDSIYRLDQSVRSEFDPRIDYSNLEYVTSLIDQCGMPQERSALKTVFYVLQHNHTIHQKKYIEQLREQAALGNFSRSTLAMMEDRILIGEGKQQLYGTQVVRMPGEKQARLDDLFEPEYVNQRRKEVGLGPIEEYLESFDIEFSVQQKVR